MELDFGSLIPYAGLLLPAVLVTVGITAAALAIGTIAGALVAVLRLGKWLPGRYTATGLVEFTLSTPVPIHLFLVFYGIPSIAGWLMPSIWVIILVLGWNQTVTMGEAYRGGIASVGVELREAGAVLGMSGRQTFLFVVLPLAVRAVLPILVSSTVSLIKDSALAGFVGIRDIMQLGSVLTARTFRAVEVYTAIAVIYFLLAYPLVRLADKMEVKLAEARG